MIKMDEDFWSDSNFVDEFCPSCGCILRYDEDDICCSCEELINETLYGRGIYGKKVDTIKHAHPTVDYAVQVTSEGEPIL